MVWQGGIKRGRAPGGGKLSALAAMIVRVRRATALRCPSSPPRGESHARRQRFLEQKVDNKEYSFYSSSAVGVIQCLVFGLTIRISLHQCGTVSRIPFLYIYFRAGAVSRRLLRVDRRRETRKNLNGVSRARATRRATLKFRVFFRYTHHISTWYPYL